jgi:hypothetical protein
MRKITAATVLAAAVAVGVVGVAADANAQAGLPSGTIKLPTNSYTSQSSESTPVHYAMQPGQKVTVVCWTQGQSVDGNDVWFRIGLDGRLGFVNRDAVSPDAYVSRC